MALMSKLAACLISFSIFSMQLFQRGKRKVQGVPQSQTAALPRPKEEEETDKSKQPYMEF